MIILGQNGTGATSYTDCWDQNTVRTLPTTGITIGVSSADAKDTAAGVGARTVKLGLLDDDYVLHYETLTLAGTTEVNTTRTDIIRVLSAEVLTVGSEGDNAGIIYIYDGSDTVTAGVPQTATKIFGRISAGDNQMLIGMFTVPAGETWRLLEFAVYQRDKSATLRYGVSQVQCRLYGGVWLTNPMPSFTSDSPGICDFAHYPDLAMTFPEKTDVRVQANMLAATPWGCKLWIDRW